MIMDMKFNPEYISDETEKILIRTRIDVFAKFKLRYEECNKRKTKLR